MWWVLIGAAVAACMGAMEEEKNAAKRFHSKQEEQRRNMEFHRGSLNRHMISANRNHRFYQLRQAHMESHEINQLAYSTYRDALKSSSGITKMISNNYSEKEKLRAEINIAERRRDFAEAKRLGESHKDVYTTIGVLLKERKKLVEQKEAFRSEMLALGAKTRELKFLIRDTCGYEGKSWFNKIESNPERKRLG